LEAGGAAVGVRPVWAMGGVGSIGPLSVLKGVGYLTILGEAGENPH